MYYDQFGRLRYKSDPPAIASSTSRPPAIAAAGAALPKVPVRITVIPSGGGDTAAIQSALNSVAALPLDWRGFRGAVLLAPGYFNVSATLILNASGVVLRGSGSGTDGSVINMTGAPFTPPAITTDTSPAR